MNLIMDPESKAISGTGRLRRSSAKRRICSIPDKEKKTITQNLFCLSLMQVCGVLQQNIGQSPTTIPQYSRTAEQQTATPQ